MPGDVVEDFGRSIVENVRDRTIASCRTRLQADSQHARSRKWRKLAEAGDSDALLQAVIPDVVDETLFYLLDAIDHGRLRLAAYDQDGKTVDLYEAGLSELGGWYVGGDWPKRYSKEPYVSPNDEG